MLRGIFLGVCAYFVAVHLWGWVLVAPSLIQNGASDFRQSYAAGSIVLHGGRKSLYNSGLQEQTENTQVVKQNAPLLFISPAYEALIFAPLAHFSFRTAYFIWLAVNIYLLALCLYLLAPFTTNLRRLYPWLPAALCLGFLPIAAALMQGQRSILLLTALCAAFWLLTEHRQVAAGLVLGLALFKFTVILPIALLFLMWRRWRVLAGFCASAAAVISLSVALVGIAGSIGYARLILSLSASSDPASQVASNLPVVRWNVMANIHGFLYGIGARGTPLELLTALASLLALSYCFYKLRNHELAVQLLAAISASVLVGHYLFFYDLSVLLLPVLILLNEVEQSAPIALSAGCVFVSMLMLSYGYGYFYLVCIPVAVMLQYTCALWRTEALTSPQAAIGRRGLNATTFATKA